MESITVFAKTDEQSRTIKAFLKALSINYIQTPQSELDKLESKLTREQKKWWLELKTDITNIHAGKTNDSMDLEDFLKELADEDKAGSLVS